MAKERKPLPGISDIDSTDSTSLGSTYIPNVEKRPTRTRKIRPGRVEISGAGEDTLIKQLPAEISGTVHHIKNSVSSRKGTVGCEAASGCPYPATHFVKLPGQPREGTYATCKNHMQQVVRKGIERGEEEIGITKIKPSHVEAFKQLRGIQNEEKNLYMIGALIERGANPSEALEFNSPENPGRKPHNRERSTVTPGSSGTPLMSEAAAAEANRSYKKANPESPINKIDVSSRWSPAGAGAVKPGNVAPKVKEPRLGEGSGLADAGYRTYVLGHDHPEDLAALKGASDSEHNMIIDAINSGIKRENAGIPEAGVKPSGFSKTANKSVSGYIPVKNYIAAPSRLDKAINEVGADQAEQRIVEFNQAAQASRQQRIEGRRTGLALGLEDAKKGIEAPRN